MKELELQSDFIVQFQNKLKNLLDKESIFNEIYVNAILNPSNTIEQEQYSGDQLNEILQNAFNEAMQELK